MRNESDLRAAQAKVVDDLYSCQRRMVVAGMGGGKTAAMLYAFHLLKRDGFLSKGVLMAPPNVAQMVWPREPAKWEELQDLQVVHVAGTPKQREKLLNGPGDLFVVSIYSTKWLVEQTRKWADDDERFGLLAIDEVTKLRGPRSKLAAELLRQIKAAPVSAVKRFQNVWGATGTIKPNGYEDLYNTYRVISGGDIWNGEGFDEWRRKRFMPMDHKGYAWKIHTFAQKEVDAQVRRWTTAVNVELDLPAFNVGDDWNYVVDLLPENRAAYDEMLERLLVEVGYKGEITDHIVVALSAAIQSGKLAQLAQGFLLDRVPDETGEELVTELVAEYPNAKLALLKEVTETLRENNETVLIPYHFRHDLENLRSLFGADVPYLGGGVSRKRTMEVIDAWNAGDIPVLPVHPMSMGHGVEMQYGGRNMLIYSPTWSGENYNQLVKRIHRPGQTKPVFIRQIVARNTVDEVKINRVQNKMEIQDAFKLMLAGVNGENE